ncbi:MAG: Ig-like domain-containing protein [Methanosphaera sp.]|nr:Ig-like domain-containing protein [Methanosphaera sp.]
MVDVVDGIATLEYTLTNSPKDYTINATYVASEYYISSKTEENAILTVDKRDAQISILDLPTTITSGQTITITVLVSDNGFLVDGGVVIFKLNGVTLNNTEGGRLNATVVNGVATVTFTVSEQYSAKDYELTAVYSNNLYNKVNETTTLTISKANITTTINPLYITQGENTTLTLTLYGQNGNLVNRVIPVNIKANGKTIIGVNATVTDGILEITLPTDTFKNNYYNITVILGENSLYNGLTLNTALIVNKDDNATKVE